MPRKITIQYRYAAFNMALGRGDFDISHSEDGIEIWVTQMGPYMNMNVAFIDRGNSLVVLVDPFDARRWLQALEAESLVPTHIILTHTHRDHTYGVKKIRERVPEVEVWGHEESVSPSLLGRIIFRRMDFTNVWTHRPDETELWTVGSINLQVTHSPGHAPGHVTFHGHGVYVAGDLLFTMRSGRVDLPGSDPQAQWRSLRFARDLLRTLPSDWRLIPGHRYDWIDGTAPDWVTISEALEHNLSLNAPDIDAFDALPYNRFDDELAD
ncbi:MAG: MBL fold metallo-hydrolase [Candidatus Thermoplasmatota archaeon]|nr:MBL fold metallo-hydrolase [Candidatus Thermoplasmatota archaeon]